MVDDGGWTDLIIPGRGQHRGPGTEGGDPDRGATGLDEAGEARTQALQIVQIQIQFSRVQAYSTG